MQPSNINTVITELTSLYTSLNKSWKNDPCTTNIYQSFRQEEYHKLYEKLKGINLESIILDIITHALDDKILARLRNLLNENIQIYHTKQNQFTNIDLQEIYTLYEKSFFDDKLALLVKDRKDIKDFPYPSEEERQMLLKENQKERNQLENERSDFIRTNIWMIKDFYTLIFDLSKSFQTIIDSYFPVEKEKITQPVHTDIEIIPEHEEDSHSEIDPETIFRTGKYDKFLTLEAKLISDKYLNTDLNWISTHKNGKPDRKRLIIFLVALIDNNYFLPGKDTKIKTYFESRYHITIGQNFERKRREQYIEEYKAVFYDYPF